MQMKNLQESLLNRAKLLLDVVQNQQPELSTAERKYHRELKERNQKLAWYKNKIEKVTIRMKRENKKNPKSC